MKKFLTFASLVLCVAIAHTTTVIAPTFDELCASAEFIFQGKVTNVQSQWIGEGGERRIVSYVTFHVEDKLKGDPGASYTIRMLGGTVDGHTMEVAEGPKFKAGDRDVVFIENNGSQFIPLVGIMYGRFKVQQDGSGREVIASNSGDPVGDLQQLGKEGGARQTTTMSAADFRSAVRQKLQQQSAEQARVR